LNDKNGQVVQRHHPSGRSYGLRLATGNGRRLYLALGHERDGWTRELAQTALLVVASARRAPITPDRRARG
jgi:hypothetical protein